MRHNYDFFENSPIFRRPGEPAYPDGMRLNENAGFNRAFTKRVQRDGHPGQPAYRLKCEEYLTNKS